MNKNLSLTPEVYFLQSEELLEQGRIFEATECIKIGR